MILQNVQHLHWNSSICKKIFRSHSYSFLLKGISDSNSKHDLCHVKKQQRIQTMVNFIIPMKSANIKPQKNSTNMSGKPFNNFFENFIRLKGVHLIELMVIFTFTAHLVQGSKNKKRRASSYISTALTNNKVNPLNFVLIGAAHDKLTGFL